MLPGRASGYPTGPPTDPDVKISLIRFLGNQSIGTTLAHNFAALQTILDAVDDSGFRQRPALAKYLKLLPGYCPLVTAAR